MKIQTQLDYYIIMWSVSVIFSVQCMYWDI